MKEQEGISQSEYGRRHGWVHSYVSKLVSEGKISTLPNGRIDPVEADKELARNRAGTHGAKGRSLADDDGTIDLSTLSEQEGKELMLQLWDAYCWAAATLWQASEPKKLVKATMLRVIRGLR